MLETCLGHFLSPKKANETLTHERGEKVDFSNILFEGLGYFEGKKSISGSINCPTLNSSGIFNNKDFSCKFYCQAQLKLKFNSAELALFSLSPTHPPPPGQVAIGPNKA